jgi:surface antigen
VWYARDRRPDLGAAGGSAQDYIDNYKDSVYQLDESQMQAPLQSSNVRPGHAIVWKAGSKGANETHGHVGIVEEVHADHIIISEANWNGPGIKKRKISKSDLQGLYFVP